ncbi:symporter small accessory protein [Sporomusa carbonis]
MLGLTDPWVALAYLLCLGSTVFCIAYAAWKSKKISE